MLFHFEATVVHFEKKILHNSDDDTLMLTLDLMCARTHTHLARAIYYHSSSASITRTHTDRETHTRVKHSMQHQQYFQISSDIRWHTCIQYNHVFKPRYLYSPLRYYSLVVIQAIMHPLQHTNTAINCSWKFNLINPFICIGWHHTRTAVTLSLFGIELQLMWHLFATVWWLSGWWSAYTCKGRKTINLCGWEHLRYSKTGGRTISS